MKNRRNYYRLLHVQPDAPTEIIKSSYRTLMHRLRMHPDLGGKHFDATLINEAYAVLANPAKRAAYDRNQRARNFTPVTLRSGRTYSPGLPACPFCGTAHTYRTRIPPEATCASCGSPLQPASRRRLEGGGKRAVGRIARRYAVTYFTAWPDEGPYAGETRDISLQGLQFMAVAALPIARLVKLDCEPVAAIVRVVGIAESDDRRWPWLVRAEYLTVRFRRTRGAFLSARA